MTITQSEVLRSMVGYKLCRRCYRSIWIEGCKECVYCGASLAEPHIVKSMEVTNIRLEGEHTVIADVKVTLLPAMENIALDCNALVAIVPTVPTEIGPVPTAPGTAKRE